MPPSNCKVEFGATLFSFLLKSSINIICKLGWLQVPRERMPHTFLGSCQEAPWGLSFFRPTSCFNRLGQLRRQRLRSNQMPSASRPR